MDENPITQKLQELFELLNSGAITKDEYDSLKSDLIKNSQVNQEEKDQDSIRQSEEHIQKVEKVPTGKRKWMRWLIPLILLLIIGAVLFVFMGPKNKNQNIKASQKVFEIWDETTANDIIMNELKSHAGWDFQCRANWDKAAIQHRIGRYNSLTLNGREIVVVMTGTNLDSQYCPPCCDTEVSVFEFENNNGWRLYQKAIGFAPVNSNEESGVKFIDTPNGNYGIQITYVHSAGRADGDEPYTRISKYTFVEKKLIEYERH